MYLKNSIFLLSLSLMVICIPRSILASTKIYPVQWFPAFNMAKQLPKKVPVNNQQDVQALLDKPWYFPYKLINAQAERVFSADRCSQILPTITQLESYFSYEYDAYRRRAIMCIATQSIANARPAQYNALSNFKLDANFPLLAPKNLALTLARSEMERVLQNKAVVSWAQAETVKFVSKKDEYQAKYELAAAFQMAAVFQTVSLIARGDFNHDGIEDLLLFARAHVVGGSNPAYRLFWITKIDENSPITLVREYPSKPRDCDWGGC